MCFSNYVKSGVTVMEDCNKLKVNFVNPEQSLKNLKKETKWNIKMLNLKKKVRQNVTKNRGDK